MQHVIRRGVNEINLQATLATSSAGLDGDVIYKPHHPITCPSRLFYHEDGRFECEHGGVAPGESRTQACIDHSIALLLIELAVKTLG